MALGVQDISHTLQGLSFQVFSCDLSDIWYLKMYYTNFQLVKHQLVATEPCSSHYIKHHKTQKTQPKWLHGPGVKDLSGGFNIAMGPGPLGERLNLWWSGPGVHKGNPHKPWAHRLSVIIDDSGWSHKSYPIVIVDQSYSKLDQMNHI